MTKRKNALERLGFLEEKRTDEEIVYYHPRTTVRIFLYSDKVYEMKYNKTYVKSIYIGLKMHNAITSVMKKEGFW